MWVAEYYQVRSAACTNGRIPSCPFKRPTAKWRYTMGKTVPEVAPMIETHRQPNRLIHEASPYLLQHAHNPVDWYPWGDEALTKAKQEDKPILLSVGYSACH